MSKPEPPLDHAGKPRQLAAKRKALEAQIAVFQAEGEGETADVMFAIEQDTLQTRSTQQNADALAHRRAGAQGGNARTAPGGNGRTKGKQ